MAGTAGSGGIAGTGGTGGSGGAPEVDPPPLGGPYEVFAGGYVVSGEWHGGAWTVSAGEGTIEPADFQAIEDGDRLCVSGVVASNTDGSNAALLGINLNQTYGEEELMTWFPDSAGIHVEVENLGGSPLRLQVQGPDGAVDEDDRWCAPIVEVTDVAWGSFSTQCWSGLGAPYAGEPLEAVILVVPGSSNFDVPFSFCVDVVEVTDTIEDTSASCLGLCGGFAEQCACDAYCLTYGDCCPDYASVCGG